MQSPTIQFLPSLVTEDDDKVEEYDVDDKNEVGYAEEKFHLSGGGGCSKQSNKRTKSTPITYGSTYVSISTPQTKICNPSSP